ncbi:hypothetical protein [Marinobacter sp. X15-166B]|uniref:hypothetical protein n=1 Tax=Marinobacter sp. X15-166B TaxID=1897620 RepID=UPI001D1792D0|nr:hypothetical protein [Marinobacter sp. X15-166B]
MKSVDTEADLVALLECSAAVLVLFGGANCGVCQAIKPQLARLPRDGFPELVTVYVDCQAAAASLCATRGVFFATSGSAVV